MSILVVLSILWIHFIADFVFQTNWMAINKSKRWSALTAHCVVYSICFFPLGWKFVLLTFLLHFITDAITSRITSKFWFVELSSRTQRSGEYPFYARFNGEKRTWFFIFIGFDQWLHAAALLGTYVYLKG